MAVESRRYRLPRLPAAPRPAPALPAALLAVAAALVLAVSGGGYEPKVWYPAALFLLGLLVVSLVAMPGAGRPPRAALAAAGLLFAYAAWSHLSIAWADDQGAAVEGAGRALLYALVFAPFALWPLDGRSAYVVVGALGLGIAAIGLVELIKLDASSEPAPFFVDRRLSEPVGYHNGNAALWFIGFWPCVVLAARREVPPLLRGLGLGGACLLLGLALMGQSRGWFFSLPVVTAFFIAVVPGRARAIVTLVALAAAALAMADPVLDLHDSFSPGGELPELVDGAAGAVMLGSAVLALLGLGVGLIDRRVAPPAAVASVARRAVAALAAIAVVAAVAVWIERSGNPVDTVSDAWAEFKRGDLPQPGEPRFTASLGSGRYDIWRVAWERFEEEPLGGIGADNFQQDYLERGRTLEQPVHPHSLELRILSQTGIVGALLLLGALVAAGAAAASARRRASWPAAPAVAAALTAFAYWLVHGSVDWFWELPGLSAAAFAMLGVAVACAPRRAGRTAARGGRWAARAAGGLCLLLAAGVLGAGWLAELRVGHALEVWRSDPAAARDELDAAADLNP